MSKGNRIAEDAPVFHQMLPGLIEAYAERLSPKTGLNRDSRGRARVEELQGILSDSWHIEPLLGVGVFEMVARNIEGNVRNVMGSTREPAIHGVDLQFSVLSKGWRSLVSRALDQGKDIEEVVDSGLVTKYQTPEMAILHDRFVELPQAGKNFRNLQGWLANLGIAWVKLHSCSDYTIDVDRVNKFYNSGEYALMQEVRTRLDTTDYYFTDQDPFCIFNVAEYDPCQDGLIRGIFRTTRRLIRLSETSPNQSRPTLVHA